MQIEFQFYWENARTNMNRVMKLKPSGGCRTFLAAFVATLASVAQLFAADAVISWSNPADIVYGTALSNAQLNATFTNPDTGAQVQGTTHYNPLAGTFLNAGAQQTLQVTFIPNANQGVTQNAVTKTVNITVQKAPLTATALSKTLGYGLAVKNFVDNINGQADKVTYSGFVLGDTTVSVTGVPSLKPPDANELSPAGTVRPITFDVFPTAPNYNITAVNGTLTIVQKPLIFVLQNANKTYGADPDVPSLNVAVGQNGTFGGQLNGQNAGRGIGWENNQDTKVIVNQVHNVTNKSNVGTYDINVDLSETEPGILANYDLQIQNGIYTVNKRNLIVSVNPNQHTINYGGDLPTWKANWAIDEAGGDTFTAHNNKAGDNAETAITDILSSGVSIARPAANSNVAGSPHAVKISGGTAVNGNFNIVVQNGQLIVNKAPLTIAPTDRFKITGTQLPGLTDSPVEFPVAGQLKFGEQPSAVVKVWPPVLQYNFVNPNPDPTAGDTTNNADLNVNNGIGAKPGTYSSAIVFKNALTADNYQVTMETGDLFITLQPLQGTWTPSESSMTYGAPFTSAKHLNAAGTTTVTLPQGGTAGVPFTIKYEAFNSDNAKVADVIDGSILNAGTYRLQATITPDAVGIANLEAANAGLDVPDFGALIISRTFTVNKAVLKVTAAKQERQFAQALFNANGFAYEGFKTINGNAETAAVLNTAPVIKDPTNAASPVAKYPIIPSDGADNNYAFNYVGNILEIKPADTSISWDPPAAGGDAAKHVTYGTALSATGNLNAVPNGGVTGTITYDKDINDPRALTFPSTNVKATFTPDSPNYAASTLTKLLNVKRLSVDISPQGHDLLFGDDIPTLGAASAEGFLAGDGIVTTYKTTAVKGSPVGDHFITAEFKDTFGRLKNYNIKLSSVEENRIKIRPATLNIEVQNASGAVNPAAGAGAPDAAKLKVKLFGLKAEGQVLNGIALTRDQLKTAFNNTTITIGNDTYNNNNSSLPTTPIDVKGRNLLVNVFTAEAKIPTFNVPNFSDDKKASFPINLVIDTKTDDGDGLAIGGNYVLGTVNSATYGIDLAEPTVTAWPDSTITYGAAIGDNELDAVIANPPQTADKKGTFVYRLNDANGPAAKGLVLGAGQYTLHLTYTPHPDFANQFLGKTATAKLTVNPAPLDVRIPAINDFVYGNPPPVLAANQLIWNGTKDGNGNVIRSFVNGDTAESVFNAPGAIQPVVGIIPNPNIVDSKMTVAHSPARMIFGQQPVAKNYAINVIPNVGNGAGPAGTDLVINRRPLTVKPMDTNVGFGDNAVIGLEYIGLAPGETVANLANPGSPFMAAPNNINAINTLQPNTYTLFAGGAFGGNYVVTHTTGTLVVGKAVAVINVSGNVHTYDGGTKNVTVTTQPAGLNVSISYNGSPQPPVNAGNYPLTITVNDANYQGVFNGTLVINPASATISFADTVQVYDGTPKMATVTTVPAGVAVTTTYNKALSATAAGTYEMKAAVSDPNYTGSNSGSFVLNKAEAQIGLSNTTHVFDGNKKSVAVTTTPAGLNTVVTYNGQTEAPSAVGTYAVQVSVVDTNYRGTFSGQMEILSAATISFSNLSLAYTGSVLKPTVTTKPEGLKVNLTYNKNPNAPSAAGTYEVVAVIEDALYKGSAKANFKITKATATVTFVAGSLESNWKTPVAAQVTTNPAGLNTVITYNGSTNLPTEPGDYEVVATVVTSNYSGSATATYTLGKAPQVISFPAVPNLTINGQSLLLILNATSDSGLPVNYTVTAGSATINGNLLTVSQPGSVVVTAQQLGNDRYAAAEEKVRSFQVTGTGVPLGAPQTTASLTDDGDVSLSVSGQPFTTLSVYAADVLTGDFKAIVKIGLDENGKGTYNTPVEGAERFFQVK